MQEITRALQAACSQITEGTDPRSVLALSQSVLNLATALGSLENAEYLRRQNEGASGATQRTA